MLKQRVVTALILITFVLAALFASNPVYWRLLVSVAILGAFWEWLRFCQIDALPARIVCLVLFGAAFASLQAGWIPLADVVYASCLVWVLLLIFTATDYLDGLHHTAAKLPMGVIILSSAAWLVIQLKQMENGALWIICFFVSVFAADIGAYFVGRRFGRTKLAPNISPGKTVEGLAGGIMLVLMVFLPLLFTFFRTQEAGLLLLTVLVTALVSVGGDLFESKMKRHVGLKDSSQILPGHGGILDRIDSLLAGAPFFFLGMILLGYIGE